MSRSQPAPVRRRHSHQHIGLWRWGSRELSLNDHLSLPFAVRKGSSLPPIWMKFGVYQEVDEWCTTVCIWPDPRSRSIKVTWRWKLKILPFSKAISSAIFCGSWQVTDVSKTRAKYLNLLGPDFWHVVYFLCHVTLNLEENWDVTCDNFSSDLNEIRYVGCSR